MRCKKITALVISLIFVFTFIFPLAASATVASNTSFSDVPENHWAHSAVDWAFKKGIIEGDNDGTAAFKPDRAVARDEFAKMMVLTLKLALIDPETATFKDVKKGSWQYKYVEAAKNYLTVYKTESGDLYYHPAEAALREDMAVALVKALGLSGETADLTILNDYIDKDSISPKLLKYVAIAVKNKIMAGSVNKDGKKVFAPQETLTRAQSAVLLYNAFKQNEEKTVLDGEEKDVYDGPIDTEPVIDNGQYTVPEVRAVVENGKVVVRWKAVSSKNFVYYKVVASKSNAKPAYPDDGYFACISDINTTYSYLKSGDSYNDGDFGGKLKAGETYYFSVTAVYKDKKVAGNAVKLTMPVNPNENNTYDKPVVKASISNGKVLVKWNVVDNNNFTYYKVVVSKNNANPAYPGDGYYTYITDINKTYAYLSSGDSYNGGDFGGKLKAGVTYYFSVTAVYGDKKVAGNAVKLTMPGTVDSSENNGYDVPVVKAVVNDGKVIVNWNAVDNNNFTYYKVVVSKYDSHPAYPEDGYFEYITDINKTTSTLESGDCYQGGDFGGELKSGEYYYFSITAVYGDKKVPGNAIRLKMP